MKIALLSTDNPYKILSGGKHVHLLLLEKGLKKLGHEVDTYYYNFNFIEKVKIILNHPNYKFLNPADRFKLRIDLMIRFYEELDLRKYDIVNAHDVISGHITQKNKNLVTTIHGYFAYETINYSNFSADEANEILNFCIEVEREAISRSQQIIAVDSRIKRYIIEKFQYPDERVSVIHNAVDTDKFAPVSLEEKQRLRKLLGVPVDAFIVFIPRRFVKKNGVLFAAESVKIVEDKNIFFIFAGRGPLKEEVISILQGKDNVKILDAINHFDVDKYYKLSDVILVPSITSDNVEEATSLSMLEGMACGKVVICTNVGGMAEVIKNGTNGFLIPQQDPQAIANAIVYANRHYKKLEEMRENAREYVVKNHSYTEHAKKFVEVYRKALD
ncbi:MAG: glycosyltransferase family 4 protein [Fervidobacterium sp.]